MNTDQDPFEGRGLTSEKLQMFVATLSGLNDAELTKAKSLFIKNELSELKSMLSIYDGCRTAQGCFSLIPFFWPILKAQRTMLHARLQLQIDQINNALDIWGEELDSAEYKEQVAILAADVASRKS